MRWHINRSQGLSFHNSVAMVTFETTVSEMNVHHWYCCKLTRGRALSPITGIDGNWFLLRDKIEVLIPNHTCTILCMAHKVTIQKAVRKDAKKRGAAGATIAVPAQVVLIYIPTTVASSLSPRESGSRCANLTRYNSFCTIPWFP